MQCFFVFAAAPWFSLVVASVSTQSRQLRLREARFSHAASEETSTAVPEDVLRLSREYFVIQRASLQDSGDQVRSPYNLKDNFCLTAGTGDALDGYGVYWRGCEDLSLIHVVDPRVHEAQLFSLTTTGMLKSKIGGFCMRRATCTQGRNFYDLASCEDENLAVFEAQKLIGGKSSSVKSMGFPLQAVASEMCNVCGPYMFVDICSGSDPVRSVCTEPQPEAGWTRLRTQWLGYARRSADTVEERFDHALYDRDIFSSDKTSLGTTGDSGICGSFVSQAPVLTGFFYILRENGGQ